MTQAFAFLDFNDRMVNDCLIEQHTFSRASLHMVCNDHVFYLRHMNFNSTYMLSIDYSTLLQRDTFHAKESLIFCQNPREDFLTESDPSANGLTMEFLPEDNTILQIEGMGHKITKITKLNIIIEEELRQMDNYSIHKVRKTLKNES